MVTPAEIKRKALNLFPQYLQARVAGDPFFPRDIPCNKDVPPEWAAAEKMKLAIEAEAVGARGFGYSIEWRRIRRPGLGHKPWPKKIYFAAEADYLRYLGKEAEVRKLNDAVRRVRTEFPQLENWIRQNPTQLFKVASFVDDLLIVVQYFVHNSEIDRSIREVPGVHTKFVERNAAILTEWLDLVLPSHRIGPETRFERRFGLRIEHEQLDVRPLDEVLARELGLPCAEIRMHLDDISRLAATDVLVFVVENGKILRRLPEIPRTIAFGRLGDAAVLLARVPWIQYAPIRYWGDLDVAGLEALSTFRARLPQTMSFLMDEATLDRYATSVVNQTPPPSSEPVHLTPTELAAFRRCRDQQVWVEHEHIPDEAVQTALATW